MQPPYQKDSHSNSVEKTLIFLSSPFSSKQFWQSHKVMSDYKGTGTTCCRGGELHQAYKGCNKMVFKNPQQFPDMSPFLICDRLDWALSSTKGQNSVFQDARRGNATGRVLLKAICSSWELSDALVQWRDKPLFLWEGIMYRSFCPQIHSSLLHTHNLYMIWTPGTQQDHTTPVLFGCKTWSSVWLWCGGAVHCKTTSDALQSPSHSCSAARP